MQPATEPPATGESEWVGRVYCEGGEGSPGVACLAQCAPVAKG